MGPKGVMMYVRTNNARLYTHKGELTMSRRFTKNDEGQNITYVFDNPCEGFYAYVEPLEEGDWPEISIGILRGVTLDELKEWATEYNLTLDFASLELDKLAEEQPLSPIQLTIKKMFEGLL